jgi:hypothetical protein
MKKKAAGKGKKTCPECKQVVGARTKVCSCGHVFSVGESKKSAGKNGEANELTLTKLALKHGGLAKLKTKVGEIKTDELIDTMIVYGSPSKMIEAIDKLDKELATK